MPCDIVRLPCGSMSTQRTRWPSSTKATARLRVVVVLATPPFWLAKAITLALPFKTRSDHGRENPSQGVCSRRQRRFLPRARGRGRPPRVTIVVMTDGPERTGLAHVATVSFLGSRAAPAGPFWLALPGGVALARVAARLGLRSGYGASAAAVLQTVAVMGPARINNPLTQAMTAPLLGRMEDRGRPAWLQVGACFALRFVHYTVLTAIYIWVVLGGLDAFTGSYQTLTGWVGFLSPGEGGGPAPAGPLHPRGGRGARARFRRQPRLGRDLQHDPGARLPARAARLAGRRRRGGARAPGGTRRMAPERALRPARGGRRRDPGDDPAPERHLLAAAGRRRRLAGARVGVLAGRQRRGRTRRRPRRDARRDRAHRRAARRARARPGAAPRGARGSARR